MAKVKCTRFDDLKASRAHADTLRVTMFTNPPEADRKEDLPLFKLATFGDIPTTSGSLRHDGNVLSVTGAEVDYDAGEITFEEARSKLLEAGLDCVLYTSPSHLEAAPRWRVVAPFRKEFAGSSVASMKAHRALAVTCLCDILEITANPESLRLSQAYYYGAVDADNYQCARLTGTRRVDELMGSVQQQPSEREDEDDPFAALPDPAARDNCRKLLPRIDPDVDRDTWVKVGAAVHHSFQGEEEGFELFDEWSSRGEKYAGEWDTRKRWDSYLATRGARVTVGSLFHLAGPEPEVVEGGFNLFGWDELDFGGDAPRQLVEDVFAYGQSTLISAQPNTGKSAFALDLAEHVAAGVPWQGREVEQGTALYVCAESPATIEARMRAAKRRRDGDLPLYATRDPIDLASVEARKAFKARLMATVGVVGELSLLVIDTFRSATAGLAENDSEAMGPVVNFLHQLAAELDCVVIIVHHTTKAGTTYAGSGVFGGIVDTEILITDETDTTEAGHRGCIVAWVKQQRGMATKGTEFFYRIESAETSRITNFGKPETAPLVIHLSEMALQDEAAQVEFARAQREEAELDEDVDRLVAVIAAGASSAAQQRDSLGMSQRRHRVVRERGVERGLLEVIGEGQSRRYTLVRHNV
jgi:hypothetical protein